MGKNDLSTVKNQNIDWVYEPGKFGTCLGARGNNVFGVDFINSQYQMSIANDFCISAWVQRSFSFDFYDDEFVPGSTKIIVENNIFINNNTNKFFYKTRSGFSTYTNPFSEYPDYDYNTSSGYEDIAASSEDFRHIIVQRTYDNVGTATITTYADGVQAHSFSIPSSVIAGRTDNADKIKLSITSNTVGGATDYSKIDSLRIYHRALSAEEIQQLAAE